jgi:hypothetical protein
MIVFPLIRLVWLKAATASSRVETSSVISGAAAFRATIHDFAPCLAVLTTHTQESRCRLLKRLLHR